MRRIVIVEENETMGRDVILQIREGSDRYYNSWITQTYEEGCDIYLKRKYEDNIHISKP